MTDVTRGCRASLIERFEAQYIPEPNSGCWLWIGSDDGKNGYGKIMVNGVRERAHRASWEMFRGPVPDGHEIDHLCRIPCCVNPNHLEPVLPVENRRRGKLGILREPKTHCPHGHPYSGDNLYIDPKGCLICRTCVAAATRDAYRKQHNVPPSKWRKSKRQSA